MRSFSVEVLVIVKSHKTIFYAKFYQAFSKSERVLTYSILRYLSPMTDLTILVNKLGLSGANWDFVEL